MTVWFTSDTHYGHAGIVRYANRPFPSVEEMDEAMITQWNAAVRPGDVVYHLGDFALCAPSRAIDIARRLKGRKHLIWGNHDQLLRRHVEFIACWADAKDLTQIVVDRQKITLCHYSMRTWASSHHGAWQLYGHSHGTLPDLPHALSLDVGVDCWNYAPVSFETLRDVLSRREWHAIDKHAPHSGESRVRDA